MPKELTHWHVARGALHSDIPGQVREIITDNPELFYLGAVAHDIPFYDLSQPPETSIERIGELLHGVNGENTLLPLIDFTEKSLALRSAQYLLSFILGMLTHYITDSIFHPMVYYLSGNYYDKDNNLRSKAIFRHRLLETAIDLWLETEEPLDYPLNLAALWRKTGPRGHQALSLIVEHYTVAGDKGIAAHFRSAWRNHRIFQAAFKWSIPWRILSFYRRFGHPGVEKHVALFYPQPLDLSLFNTVFVWSHPVTGEQYAMTLGEIYKTAIERVVSLFTELGAQSISKWPQVLREQKPYSLDSGLPYVPVSDMKYFAGEPIESMLKFKS